jgi:membrane dipeptidase
MIIVDGHADLAWNMLTFGRDYTRSAAETRRLEAGSIAQQMNDDSVLGWADYQRGQVAFVFASLFAAPIRRKAGDWEHLCYADFSQAHQLYRQQVDVYDRLADEHPHHFRLVRSKNELREVHAAWKGDRNGSEGVSAGCPVGLVISMEGAEGVREPAELEDWYARGVRLVGPAWAGTRFCGGTGEPGKLTSDGYALLEAMASFSIGLDLSHMDETAALQASDFYPGPIFATHANVMALLKDTDSNRHLSDRVIRGLIERDGVIGVVPANMFLRKGWKRGDARNGIGLRDVLAHIDYICQMAGDAQHVGLGTDFDGGFGLQSLPEELDTIADLQRLAPLLEEKGYSHLEIAAILGENWLRILDLVLP